MDGAGMVWADVRDETAAQPAVTPRVVRVFSDLETPWRALERDGAGGPFQRFDYYSPWYTHVGKPAGATPLVITGELSGRIVYILPLVVERRGLFKVARFAGGTHANHNTGLFDPRSLPALTESDALAAFRAVGRAAPEVDLLHLAGQPLLIAGRANPFVTASARPWLHRSYEIDLKDGFEGVLGRHRGGKKRKRERQQARAFDGYGDWSFRRAETAAEAHRILDAFAEQKAVRFAEQGLPNIFAEPGVLDFFHEVVERSHQGGPRTLECYGLEVAGKIRATFVAAPFGSELFGLMNAIATDDVTAHSPGDYLTFHLIKDSCERGFQRFDFGIGDARYKRSWVDGDVTLMETLVPLTLKGRVPMAALRLEAAGRTAVSARPELYRIAQRVRRTLRGQRTEAPENTD